MTKCIRCNSVELPVGSICDSCLEGVLKDFYDIVQRNRRGRALLLLESRTLLKVAITDMLDRLHHK